MPGVPLLPHGPYSHQDTTSHPLIAQSLSWAILENLGEAVFLVHPRGHLLYMNAAACALLGWTLPETQGRHVHELFHHSHPDGQAFPVEHCPIFGPNAQAGSVIQNHEDCVFHRDGHPIPCLTTISPLWQQDELVGYIVSLRQITARKQMEASLRQSESRLRHLMDSNMIGIVFADVYGAIEHCNDVFLKMLGYTAQDMTCGRLDWLRMTPPEYLIPYQDLLHRVQADGCIHSYESQLITQHHHRVDVLLSITLQENSTSQLLILVQDISAQKQHERMLQDSQASLRRLASELELSNRMLGDFASIASHDLKAPLRKIRTFSELLQALPGRELTDEHLDYITRIHAAVLHMDTLITDLLALGQISAHRNEFSSVPLGPLIQAQLVELNEQIQDSNAQLAISGDLTIQGDPIQLGQLFHNLLSNAIKFRRHDTPLKIRISIEAVPEPNICQVRVQDNGIGFPPQQADHIFETFVRLHAMHEYPGTGIGLAICKKIVERHQGDISAQGRPGEGASFTVRLPYAP